MQQFEAEGAMDLQTTERQQNIVFPVRTEEDIVVCRIHGPEYQKQKKEIWQACRRESLSTRDKVQVIAGTSMVSRLQQLLQRHTSRVSK